MVSNIWPITSQQDGIPHSYRVREPLKGHIRKNEGVDGGRKRGTEESRFGGADAVLNKVWKWGFSWALIAGAGSLRAHLPQPATRCCSTLHGLQPKGAVCYGGGHGSEWGSLTPCVAALGAPSRELCVSFIAGASPQPQSSLACSPACGDGTDAGQVTAVHACQAVRVSLCLSLLAILLFSSCEMVSGGHAEEHRKPSGLQLRRIRFFSQGHAWLAGLRGAV